MEKRIVKMTNEPEMDWQVPCLPVLFDAPAVPPVTIEVPVPEIEDFTHDVEPKMEHTVKPCDPDNGVGHCNPEMAIEDLVPDEVLRVHDFEEAIKLGLNVLDP